MTDTIQSNFERRCRLCAQEQEVTIMLFSHEASDLLLLEKLHHYLLIEIDYSDTLPKNICIKCCVKLQHVCEFIEQVRKAQDNLQSLCSASAIKEISGTFDAKQKEAIESEEICTKIGEGINMSEETDKYYYPFTDEIVTLKLIEKDNRSKESKSYQSSIAVAQPLIWGKSKGKGFASYYKCGVCTRRFKTEQKYQKHMRLHNPAVRKKCYTCDICSKAYQNLAEIQAHRISHCNERPFQCSHCPKSYKRSQELKLHIFTHAGRNPSDCEQCAQTGSCNKHTSNATPVFKQDWDLDDTSLERQRKETSIQAIAAENTHNTHMYKCHVCLKEFGRHENYSYHVYKHNGKKPYECTVNQCTSTFFTHKNLVVHYKKMHPTIS